MPSRSVSNGCHFLDPLRSPSVQSRSRAADLLRCIAVGRGCACEAGEGRLHLLGRALGEDLGDVAARCATIFSTPTSARRGPVRRAPDAGSQWTLDNWSGVPEEVPQRGCDLLGVVFGAFVIEAGQGEEL